jgi:hypothetical protein
MICRELSVGLKTGYGGDQRTGMQHAQRPIDFRASERGGSDESAKRVIAAKGPRKLPVREQRGIQPRQRTVDAQPAANQVFVTSGIDTRRQSSIIVKKPAKRKNILNFVIVIIFAEEVGIVLLKLAGLHDCLKGATHRGEDHGVV